MVEITNNDILEFMRLLVNLGNAYHLNEATMTIEKPDGQACCATEGDQVKPIQLLFNGMVADENNAILNPFKMVEGNNPALTWFYQSRITILGVLVKKIILKLVELGFTKESEDYSLFKLISGISDQCDKTMVDELSKINGSDYLRIFYNKKIKTAEPQTAVFTDSIETQYKFRKKTWHVLSTIFKALFKLDGDDTTLAKYSYRATILSIPEIDAKLHVMAKVIEIIDEPCRILLNTDLHSAEFTKHVANLEVYAKMYAWFTSKVTANKTQVVSNQPKQKSEAWTETPGAIVCQSSNTDADVIKVDAGSSLPMRTAMMPKPNMTQMAQPPMPYSQPMMAQPNMMCNMTQMAQPPMPYSQPMMAQPNMMVGTTMPMYNQSVISTTRSDDDTRIAVP